MRAALRAAVRAALRAGLRTYMRARTHIRACAPIYNDDAPPWWGFAYMICVNYDYFGVGMQFGYALLGHNCNCMITSD